jgi:hypothetical protein
MSVEFERKQLEILVGKAGWEISEGQDLGSHVSFKIKKRKVSF